MLFCMLTTPLATGDLMPQTRSELIARLELELEDSLALEAQGLTFPDDAIAADGPCEAPVADHRPSHKIRADIAALQEIDHASY